jgi:hypothetical protein
MLETTFSADDEMKEREASWRINMITDLSRNGNIAEDTWSIFDKPFDDERFPGHIRELSTRFG